MTNLHEEPLTSAHLEEADTPEYVAQKHGFLPIETNWFDRLFISVVIWVALSLFWFRFLEPVGMSIWISNVIAFALTVFIVTKG
ncbi:MAG: hypothetical protein HWE23_11375 [Rhodobacteraceae bacterium]|nr:hypothetical protein [Paracoccaceae bacterium]